MTQAQFFQEVAEKAQLSRTQVRAVLQKLGVHSQLEAVALASRAGWSLSPAAAAQNARRYRSSRPRDARSGSVRRVGSGPIEASS